ncbi:MAG TPA: hypothetical protein VHC47_09985 [Mucilaginibacter sp.]|nr:hypothetical protein [Mucilaginibacter sp.]
MSIKTHIDNWISKAELDYYTMFIKAWIPLNAWYFAEYSTKKDGEALEKIRNTKNKVRNKIESLLINNDIPAKNFKKHLSDLHIELESRSVMNYGKLVSFKAVIIDGIYPAPVTDNDKKGNIYKAIPNKTTGYKAIIVDKSGKSLMDKTFNPFNYDALIIDNQYISLPNEKMREKIRTCFKEIDPNKPVSLLTKSRLKGDYLELDADSKVRFINDTELIAKATLQILYALRCILFHGELDPTEANHAIYEHAYHILKPIIKELK